MSMRSISLLVALFVICSVFVGMSIRADDLGNQVAGLERTAENTQELIDQQKFNYLSGEWRELFLKNKLVSSVDAFLHNINLLFVVLSARDYTFSLDMLFALMFWLFTFLSLPGYFFFIENSYLKVSAALAGTVLLAHILIFNYLATIAVKIIFYKSEWYWSVATFIFIILALAFYLKINKVASQSIATWKKYNKDRGFESRITVLEAYRMGLKRAI